MIETLQEALRSTMVFSLMIGVSPEMGQRRALEGASRVIHRRRAGSDRFFVLTFHTGDSGECSIATTEMDCSRCRNNGHVELGC
jgi:hypothetical protein